MRNTAAENADTAFTTNVTWKQNFSLIKCTIFEICEHSDKFRPWHCSACMRNTAAENADTAFTTNVTWKQNFSLIKCTIFNSKMKHTLVFRFYLAQE